MELIRFMAVESQEHLEALLREASTTPLNWPSPPADAAQLRIHASLDGQGPAPEKLVFDESDLHVGFLPLGAFQRLCAAALGAACPPLLQ